MIIRRRHTANFTTIGNALFNDERLKADEVGIIGYLLSRPHDWEVRRPQLARRFGYGRDAIKRVIFNGMRLGWIIAQRTHLSNGQTYVIYEIRDEPGPELSDDDIRRALSLVSSEAGETDSDGAGHDADTGDPPHTPQPAPGYPATGQPAPGNPYVVPKEGTTKTGFTKDESTKCARGFVDVREAWPAEHILSLVTCEALHAGLPDAVKEEAFRGIKPYLDDCRAQNRKVCDLATYYRERRWERFSAKADDNVKPHPIKPYSAQWHRWRTYRLAVGSRISFMEAEAKLGRDWIERSEWPPALPEHLKTG